jgi:Secretion system C-terminal sorting domain
MKSTIITFTVFFLLAQPTGAQVPVIGGHQDWCIEEPVSFDDPECWTSSSHLCTALGLPANVNLTEDAYTGTYALELKTGDDINGLPFPAVAIVKNEIRSRPEKLTGYYKADIKADDYAGIRISLMSDRGMVGWGTIEFEKSTNIYTPFEVTLEYISPNILPDSFFMSVYSSLDRPTTGTVIVLDDLAFEITTDVTIPLAEKYTTRITPNPATDAILVEVPAEIGLVSLRIFDSSGRLVEYQTFEYQTRINVSEYTAGLYLYEVNLANHEIYDKGRFKVSEHGL